jgi:peptidoglycan/xylan/chitin deacetylase (PgdA/CDA1 family)
MYHRIAELSLDPWGLAVSPKNFEQQLSFLKQTRQVMRCSEFFKAHEKGTLPSNAVAITFDDGYADNLEKGWPLLKRAGLPATLFLTTGILHGTRQFWWDELEDLIFRSRGDPNCQFTIGTVEVELTWDAEAPLPSSCWRAWHLPTSRREAVFYMLWSMLHVLPPQDRIFSMARLRQALPQAENSEEHQLLDHHMIRNLLHDNVYELGAHTVSHPSLPSLSREERLDELCRSKEVCERIAGQPVISFTYPHGDNDAASQRDVRAAGFEWACTTEQRCVGALDELFALPRIQVENVSAAEFSRKLSRISARS